MDKVRGGTPKGFQSLCTTCRFAQVIRGLNLQEEVFCRAANPVMRVSFPVETCSLYDDKRIPSRWDMEQIAWVVQSRNRGPMGFAGESSRLQITIEPPNKPQETTTTQGQPSGKKENA